MGQAQLFWWATWSHLSEIKIAWSTCLISKGPTCQKWNRFKFKFYLNLSDTNSKLTFSTQYPNLLHCTDQFSIMHRTNKAFSYKVQLSIDKIVPAPGPRCISNLTPDPSPACCSCSRSTSLLHLSEYPGPLRPSFSPQLLYAKAPGQVLVEFRY